MSDSIHFSGDITLEDYLDSIRLHRRSSRLPRVIIIVLIVMISIIVARILGESPMTWVGWMIGIAVYLLIIISTVKRSYKKAYKQMEPLFVGLKGHLDERGITIVRNHSDTIEMSWRSFFNVRKSDFMILVYQSKQNYQILLRNMFISDDDWQAAIALIESKLSEPQPDVVRGDGPNSEFSDDPNAIRFSGTVTRGMLLCAQTFHAFSGWITYWIIGVSLFLCLPTIVQIAAGNPITSISVFFLPLIFPTFILMALFLVNYVFSGRRRKRMNVLDGWITPDNLDIQFYSGRMIRSLSRYTGYRSIGPIVLLYQTPLQFKVIHRHMFRSYEDWRQALSYISDALPKMRKSTPKPIASTPNQCCECGKRITPDIAMQLGDDLVCPECKSRVIQKIKEGA